MLEVVKLFRNNEKKLKLIIIKNEINPETGNNEKKLKLV